MGSNLQCTIGNVHVERGLLVLSLIAAILAIPLPAHSQRFEFGVKVAGQITNTFTYPHQEEPHEDRVLLGPAVEFRLPRALSVEVDALYRRKWLAETFTCCVSRNPVAQTIGTEDDHFHSWELPLLLKWRLPVSRAHFFGGVGFSARNVAGALHFSGTSFFFGFPPMPVETRTSESDWNYGPIVSAGAEIRTGILRFQPEFRYTHWNNSPLGYLTKTDQVQAIVGIMLAK